MVRLRRAAAVPPHLPHTRGSNLACVFIPCRYNRDADSANKRYFKTIAKHATPEKRQVQRANIIPRFSKKTEEHNWTLVQKGNVGSLLMAGREHDPNANGADSRRVFHG